MRSMVATEVPPYFWTIKAMVNRKSLTEIVRRAEALPCRRAAPVASD